ncbi:MAG: hypothetical protein Q9191_004891 [Dirinaria sp. TL-2023a]
MPSLPPPSPVEPSSVSRPRAYTSTLPRLPSPDSGFFSTSRPRNYLPFNFGVEFEMIVRLKANDVESLGPDISVSQLRNHHIKFCHDIAQHLSRNGMLCSFFDFGDGDKPDYSRWNAVIDTSLSKHHMRDGFFPVDLVSPLICADDNCSQTVGKFWSVLLSHYELRRDTTCGLHIHISSATQNWTLDQLRSMAKAIVFWEPATARCAPLSRQDRFQDFCQSNIKAEVPVASCWTRGPLRGLLQAFDFIDNADSDAIVDYVCPDKYRAWNLRPCGTGGHGSIEFRRPPGIVTAKKAKHWIAFTMAFMEMALQFNPSRLAEHIRRVEDLSSMYHPDFERQLLDSARAINLYHHLDPRLQQYDEPRSLYMCSMHPQRLAILRSLDSEYCHSLST